MGNIDWLEISELPEAFKDGREVLIYGGRTFAVAHWEDGEWRDYGDMGWGGVCGEPTHFAEINAPPQPAAASGGE